jgi:hypothetical protein
MMAKRAPKVLKEGSKDGRPTKFKEEYCIQVEKLCKLGATDKEIADFFEVDVSTIAEWKLEYSNFSDSIKAGKQLADANVVDSLYKRAMGYSHEDVDIKMYEGSIIETKLIKHYPPDSTAMIFWLKNRQPGKWRDKQEIAVEGVSINVTRKVVK